MDNRHARNHKGHAGSEIGQQCPFVRQQRPVDGQLISQDQVVFLES